MSKYVISNRRIKYGLECYSSIDEDVAIKCEDQAQVDKVVAVCEANELHPQVFTDEEVSSQTPWIVSAEKWLEEWK